MPPQHTGQVEAHLQPFLQKLANFLEVLPSKSVKQLFVHAAIR